MREMQPQLVPLNGGPLLTVPEGRSVIGSDRLQADLWLPRPAVGQRHCEIRYQGGVCIVHDLGSGPGIFVNRRRTIRTILEPGDELDVAGCRYTLRLKPIERLEPSAESQPKAVAADRLDDSKVVLAPLEPREPAKTTADTEQRLPSAPPERVPEPAHERPDSRSGNTVVRQPSTMPAGAGAKSPRGGPLHVSHRGRTPRGPMDLARFRQVGIAASAAVGMAACWAIWRGLSGPSAESIYTTCARLVAEVRSLKGAQAPSEQWRSAEAAALAELQPLAQQLEEVAGWDAPAEQQLLFLTRDILPLAYARGSRATADVDPELTAAMERARRLLDGIPDAAPALPPEIGPPDQLPGGVRVR